MPLRESATGAGLQVAFEPAGRASVPKLEAHEDSPGTMPDRLSRRTFVVPPKRLSDVRSATDVMTRGIPFTAQNVDESLSDASHDGCCGILRASTNP